MRSGIVVVRSVARMSCSSVIVGAVTVSSMQLYSQDHSSGNEKQLAVVCAVGSAPIPRWSIIIYRKCDLEGVKSKIDFFHQEHDIE